MLPPPRTVTPTGEHIIAHLIGLQLCAANCKESRIVIQYPQNIPDRRRSLITSFLNHTFHLSRPLI